MKHSAVVHLVGAGPGDPELLTVKALRVLKQADTVVYDRLVSPEILALARPGADLMDVGKAPNFHPMPQQHINRLLVRLAREGRSVVRLKGGDPFTFGRGGEEAKCLAENRIPFEVIPGITSASGCAAQAGIPLTHRGLAHSVRYVTGHCRGDVALDLDWDGLADPNTTLVVYMGLAHLDTICRRLTTAGLPADTPAAAISRGTTPKQRIVRATLSDLPRRVAGCGLEPPVLFIIGRVAGLAETLSRSTEYLADSVAGATEAIHA